MTPHQWGFFSAHNTASAESEVQNSVCLREAMSHTVRQTHADLEAQWTATHYAFRKRKHEMEQAMNELEWQQKNVRIAYGCGIVKPLMEDTSKENKPLNKGHAISTLAYTLHTILRRGPSLSTKDKMLSPKCVHYSEIFHCTYFWCMKVNQKFKFYSLL